MSVFVFSVGPMSPIVIVFVNHRTFQHGCHVSPSSTFASKSMDQFLRPVGIFIFCRSFVFLCWWYKQQTSMSLVHLSSFWLQRSMLSSRSFFFFVIAANSSFSACSLSVTCDRIDKLNTILSRPAAAVLSSHWVCPSDLQAPSPLQTALPSLAPQSWSL